MRMLRIIAATPIASTSVAASAAEITQSGFSPLYVGIDYETATIPTSPTAAGKPYILNNPSGGAERYDAAALGVCAPPLDRSDDDSQKP